MDQRGKPVLSQQGFVLEIGDGLSGLDDQVGSVIDQDRDGQMGSLTKRCDSSHGKLSRMLPDISFRAYAVNHRDKGLKPLASARNLLEVRNSSRHSSPRIRLRLAVISSKKGWTLKGLAMKPSKPSSRALSSA